MLFGRYLTEPIYITMRYIFVAVSAVILFFPAFWLFSQVVGDDWGAGIAAFFMYIWYPFMALKYFSRNDEKEIDDMSQALAKGELQVDEYQVKDVIEIEEFEDEGLFFLLDVGENQTLCLRGQYLYEPVEKGIFPNSKIKVFWNNHFNQTYGVEGAGLKVLTKRKLPPLNEKQYDSGVLPGDRDLLNQGIDKVAMLIEDNA